MIMSIVTYPGLPQSETKFAVSSAPPTFDLHWGRSSWKTAVGNVNIKMKYLNLCPNQNHGRILISYQEYHKCNTWCHNVLTCWYYCNNWRSNLLILHYIAKIITTASSYTWWSPVGLASDFQAWPGNGLGTGNKAKLGHAILAIVRHLWQKV